MKRRPPKPPAPEGLYVVVGWAEGRSNDPRTPEDFWRIVSLEQIGPISPTVQTVIERAYAPSLPFRPRPDREIGQILRVKHETLKRTGKPVAILQTLPTPEA